MPTPTKKTSQKKPVSKTAANKKSVREMLAQAILTDDIKTVRSLLKNQPRAKLMARDASGCDALYTAVSVGNLDATRALVKYGFDPMCVDAKYNATALHIAALWGRCEMIPYLGGELNIPINVPDDGGDTPLVYALVGMGVDQTEQHAPISENIVTGLTLIAFGAKFSRGMYRLIRETGWLQKAIIDDISRICETRDGSGRSRMKREIKFMIDSMNEHNSLFFDDVLPDAADDDVHRKKPAKKAASKRK